MRTASTSSSANPLKTPTLSFAALLLTFGSIVVPLGCSDEQNRSAANESSTFGEESSGDDSLSSGAGASMGSNGRGESAPSAGDEMPGDDGSPGGDEKDGEDSAGEGNSAEEDGVPTVRFDVGAGETGGDEDGTTMLEPPERPDFSYIWIANSPENTVSKIDTATVTEVGRFRVHPGDGNPSRTSVSRTGDMVVANRNGGVTKIYATPERCEDRNGSGGIDTSTDRNARNWNDEECRAWYTPLSYESQRAIAWTPGEEGPDGDLINQKVWVTGNRHNDDGNFLDVLRLNGETGEIEEKIEIDKTGRQTGARPAYGGAVDPQGNFWFLAHPLGWIVRVDYDDLEVSFIDHYNQIYGIFVDPKGRPWFCGNNLHRYDPRDESWASTRIAFGDERIEGLIPSGCMMDAEGRVWAAGVRYDDSTGRRVRVDSMVSFDWESLELLDVYETAAHPHGISIDFDGYVWGVALGANDAYRLDPESGEMLTYSGLNQPYTYSDMTGYALGLTQIYAE